MPPEATAPPAVGDPLVDEINRRAWKAEHTGLVRHLGIYVARASGGAADLAGYGEGENFPAASVIKVPVMIAVQQHWAADRKSRTAAQQKLVQRMIQVSDNEATNELVRSLRGFQAVNLETQRLLGGRPTTHLASYLSGTGKGTSKPRNRACPREIGALLARISEEDLRGEPSASEMLRILRGTSADHRTRIPQGIPPAFRAKVANKTGTLNSYPVVNDSAIVETPDGNRYTLCIFMEDVRSRPEAERFCKQISQLCWYYLSGPNLTPASHAPLPDEAGPGPRVVKIPRGKVGSSRSEKRVVGKDPAQEGAATKPGTKDSGAAPSEGAAKPAMKSEAPASKSETAGAKPETAAPPAAPR